MDVAVMEREEDDRRILRHQIDRQRRFKIQDSLLKPRIPFSTEILGSYMLKNDIDSGQTSFHLVDDKKHILSIEPIGTFIDDIYLDLAEGYIKKSDRGGKSTVNRYELPDNSPLIEWIYHHRMMFELDHEKDEGLYFKAEFIAWRRALVTLMKSGGPKEEQVEMSVIRFKGSYFILEKKESVDNYWRNSEESYLSSHCGQRFRKYMRMPVLKENQWIDPKVNDTVYENVNVLRSTFGKHTLLFGSVIDCMEQLEVTEKDMTIYVDFHTCKRSKGQPFDYSFYKMLTWKSQCFWSGVKAIYCGIRNNDDAVTRIERIDVQRYKNEKYQTHMDNMLHQVDSFFSLVKEKVTVDDPYSSHTFFWDKKQGQWMFYPNKGAHFLQDFFIEHFL